MAMMGAVFSLVGGIVQGIGAKKQADAEAAAHEYNAQVAERNREIIHEQTLAAISDQQWEDMRTDHAIRGMFASAGISFTGSATDVMMDTIREQEYNYKKMSYKGKLMETEQTDRANLEHMGASAAKEAGQIAMVSAILGGVGGFFSQMGSSVGGAFGGSGGSGFMGGFGGGGGGGGGGAFSGSIASGFQGASNVTIPMPTQRPTYGSYRGYIPGGY